MITKTHLVRILFCVVFTIIIYRLASLIVAINLMYYISTIYFMQDQLITIPEEFDLIPIYLSAFYYIVATIAHLAVWKWIGVPEKLIDMDKRNLLSYMFPKYYKD